MQTILSIAIKDLTLSLQNHAQTAVAIVMPIVLMVIIGSAIPNGEFILNVDVVNEDNGTLGTSLVQQIENDSLQPCIYGTDSADDCDLKKDDAADDVLVERLENSDTSAAVLIPVNFSSQLQSGEVPTLTYQSNDSLTAPTIVRQSIDTAMSRVASSVIVAEVGRDLLVTDDETVSNEVFTVLYQQAETSWQAPPIIVNSQAANEDSQVGTGVNQSVPGTAAMFVLISMLNGASILVIERQTGTLQRLFSLPVPKYQIVLGKMAGPILYGLVQFTILIIVGQMIGVEWGDQWLAIAVLVFMYVLCTGALGFVLATFVKSEAQASGLAMMMAFTLAPLGGAWWPLEIVPDAMVTIGHISPIAWVMDAFKEIIWFNGDLISILPELGVLGGMTIVLTMIGVWKFSYE